MTLQALSFDVDGTLAETEEMHRQAVVTTTNRANVDALIRSRFGQGAERIFAVIVAGDEVAAKKPAPDACLRARTLLGLPARSCVAFEDSVAGLEAARAPV